MQHWYHTSFDGKVSSKRPNVYAIIPCAYAFTISQPRGSVWTLAWLCDTCHMFLHFPTSQRPPCYLTRTYLTDMIKRQRFDPIGLKMHIRT